MFQIYAISCQEICMLINDVLYNSGLFCFGGGIDGMIVFYLGINF